MRLSSIEGGRRSRICMLLIEPPDFLHPLAAARTCAWASARRFAAVLAHQQVRYEAAGLGAAGAAHRRHYVALGRKQTTRPARTPDETRLVWAQRGGAGAAAILPGHIIY